MNRPNIILIIADQLGADALSPYGNPVVRTPNIQRMADQGVLFENSFANSALCGPCRQAIYTGQFPFHQPYWASSNCGVVPNTKYFGHRMTAADYQTKSIGRLHGIPEHYNFGFQSNSACWSLADLPFNDYRHWFQEQVEKHPDEKAIQDRVSNPLGGNDRMLGDTTFLPRELSEKAWTAETAEQFLTDRNDNRPFFLHLGLLQPHLPWLTLRTEDEKYNPDEIPLPPGLDKHNSPNAPILNNIKKQMAAIFQEGFSDDDWRRFAAGYYGAVSQVDKFVGRILELVQQNGLEENTIVMLTSDHGEMLGRQSLTQKQVLYDGAIHVPLIVWGAGIPQGERRTALCEAVDILPTLLDFAGHDIPKEIEGISLKDAVNSGSAKTKDSLHSWLVLKGVIQAAVRTEKYKLYHCRGIDTKLPGPAFELYDLEKDPDELHNIFNEVSNEQVLKIKKDFQQFFYNHAGQAGCGPLQNEELGLEASFPA